MPFSLFARQHESSTAEHPAATETSGAEGAGVGGLGSTAFISIGAAISAFVVIWETITAMEKGATPIESWSGRVENFETVIDTRGSRHKRNLARLAAEEKGADVE